jgi:hypothetical protein
MHDSYITNDFYCSVTRPTCQLISALYIQYNRLTQNTPVTNKVNHFQSNQATEMSLNISRKLRDMLNRVVEDIHRVLRYVKMHFSSRDFNTCIARYTRPQTRIGHSTGYMLLTHFSVLSRRYVLWIVVQIISKVIKQV